jgi:hypothetical protein
MKVTKPEDTTARAIQFGVELETQIPATCGIRVGSYHNGNPVRRAAALTGEAVTAPKFRNATWRAERDGSIRYERGFIPCEFVSPVLSGEEGVARLREMTAFINAIGGKVNDSCGCHITVSIHSVIGTSAPAAVAQFCRKLAHIAQMNAWAIYAQTGSGRHVNSYSRQLSLEVERLMKDIVNSGNAARRSTLASECGRGMVNFTKAFSAGVIEFRAFAGTLNEKKILHHLATALGLMRRAATVQTFGRFDRKTTKKHSKIANAVQAVRRLWRVLGWVDSVPGRDCALGLFGALHAEFGSYRKVALEMAEKFEQRYPAANL